MGYTAPTTRATGFFVTAAVWDQDVVDNQNAAFPLGVDAWTDYTPTLVQTGAVTKTVTFCKYQRIGRTIFVRMRLNVTGAGTAPAPVQIGFPVTAAAAVSVPCGHGMVFDASATTRYAGTFEQASTTAAELTTDATGGSTWGTTPNIALASGDVITAQFCFEAAS